MSFDNNACVPITTLIFPDLRSSFIFFRSFKLVILESDAILRDDFLNLSKKLLKCCFTKIVVGATKAT